MKIEDLINEDLILEDLKAKTKDEVIDELSALLHKLSRITHLDHFVEAIHAREKESSTGVGFGIAIPHAKSKHVKTPSLVFGRHRDGIDYDAMDGELSQLFFMIAVPEESSNLHLQTLAQLSRKLMDERFRDQLKAADNKGKLLSLIESIDKEEK